VGKKYRESQVNSKLNLNYVHSYTHNSRREIRRVLRQLRTELEQGAQLHSLSFSFTFIQFFYNCLIGPKEAEDNMCEVRRASSQLKTKLDRSAQPPTLFLLLLHSSIIAWFKPKEAEDSGQEVRRVLRQIKTEHEVGAQLHPQQKLRGARRVLRQIRTRTRLTFKTHCPADEKHVWCCVNSGNEYIHNPQHSGCGKPRINS